MSSLEGLSHPAPQHPAAPASHNGGKAGLYGGQRGEGGREGVSKQLLRGEERVEGASEGLNDNVKIHSACSLTHKRCSCKCWPRTHSLTCLASLLRVATALPAMIGAVRTVCVCVCERVSERERNAWR